MTRFILILIGFSVAAATSATAQSPIDVNSADPGTLYFATETAGRVIPAPRVAADVAITVTGPIVRTRVIQHYTNPSDAWVEGIYTYPLPKGSAVDTLTMKVGERVIEGEIKEKQQAKRDFESARASGKRASLVVQRRPNIFSTRLANIGPGETIEIAIEYQDLIEPRDNIFELRFPMVIRPRYNPGLALDHMQARAGWGFDTDEVPDGSLITQPLVSDPTQQTNPVTLTVNFNPGFELAALSSPSHPIIVNRQAEGAAEITLKDTQVPADQDFILRWQPERSDKPEVGIFREVTAKGMHHLLMLMPDSKQASIAEPQSRDLVVVLDRSGSMSGQAIRQAKSAVRRALLRLTAKDHFNVISFASTTHMLFPVSQRATEQAIEAALDYLDDIEADGGTEMSSALKPALLGRNEDAVDALRQVIFVTDGAVGNEQALMDQIKKDLGNNRLFTVGIGSAPNSYFMEEAASVGRGTYINIAMNDDIHAAMAKLFAKIEQPKLTNIALEWPETDAIITPSKIADLYSGEPIIIAVRGERLPDTPVVITGRLDGQQWRKELPVHNGSMGSGIANLWARRQIREIDRSFIGHRTQEQTEQRREQILDLALGYHLVSEFTSLLAVEKTPARPPQSPLYSRETPANLPAGLDWRTRKQFTLAKGRVTTNVASADSVMPRRTATPMQLMLLVGFCLLIIGTGWLLVLRRLRRAELP